MRILQIIMKRAISIIFGIGLFFLASCGEKKNESQQKEITKFEAFKSKEKFLEDHEIFYPGITDSKLKAILTDKINLASEDFKNIAETGKATEGEYQDAIKKGLNRFSDVYLELDTEDRERVCNYFEELMDIVGLESSDGHLNVFMYGFDPTKK